ncbi:hypothetical protein D3C73_1371940 [compost metagenome]
MDLRGFCHQRQVTVVAAVEACRRVTAHDALQQHATRHLQAAAFEEAFGGHHLAAGHTVEVGGDAFDLVDALKVLGERVRAVNGHNAVLVVLCVTMNKRTT